jgi:hypothetical protein
MAIGKLYISHNEYNWANSDLKILNSNNIKKVIDSAIIDDFCSSPEDLGYESIGVACNSAKEIHLVEINNPISPLSFMLYGRLFNELSRVQHKVVNFTDIVNRLELVNQLHKVKKTDYPTLWTVGCSITIGVGIEYKARWGTVLANLLQMPEVTLSAPGTSIQWACDQILRSDIRENDIIVWGLTSVPRIEITNNWKTISRTIGNYCELDLSKQYWKLDYFDSETLMINSIHNILQVNNFCNKIGAKLYLANILDIHWIPFMLKEYPNFIDLTLGLNIGKTMVEFIDLGTDNSHPGPRQHQQYANKLFNFITKE